MVARGSTRLLWRQSSEWVSWYVFLNQYIWICAVIFFLFSFNILFWCFNEKFILMIQWMHRIFHGICYLVIKNYVCKRKKTLFNNKYTAKEHFKNQELILLKSIFRRKWSQHQRTLLNNKWSTNFRKTQYHSRLNLHAY